MKSKGYPKEKLTYANIRFDLRRKLRQWWALLILCLLCLVGLISVTIAQPAYLLDTSGRLGIPTFVYILVFYPLLIGISGRYVWLLYGGLRLDGRIVKDRLVSVDCDSDISLQTYRKRDYCILHFARYDKYEVPQKNHTWSKMYALSCMGEYYHASVGDEYYLVLSKPHNGKILLAYNCKMFTLEETE